MRRRRDEPHALRCVRESVQRVGLVRRGPMRPQRRLRDLDDVRNVREPTHVWVVPRDEHVSDGCVGGSDSGWELHGNELGLVEHELPVKACTRNVRRAWHSIETPRYQWHASTPLGNTVR